MSKVCDRDKGEILDDLGEFTLHIRDLPDDNEYRIYFEVTQGCVPNLKAFTSLRDLFEGVEEDLYVQGEPLDDLSQKVHGYLRIPYQVTGEKKVET